MGRMRSRNRIEIVGLFDDHSTDEPDELVIPEDLSALNDEELAALREQAQSAFDSIYGDGTGLSDDDLEQLSRLTEAIEGIQSTQDVRAQASAEREAQAAELAARVRPVESESSTEDLDSGTDSGTDSDTDSGTEVTDEHESDDEEQDDQSTSGVVADALAASTGPVRVNLSRARRRQHRPAARQESGPSVRDVLVASGSGHGFEDGTGLTVPDIASMIERRLRSYNHAQYASAHTKGQHLRQVFTLARINKLVPDDLVINSDDPGHIEEVLARATSEDRLPGGSLVASGGWCAPNETMYDLLELESRDGLFSVPTVVWARGGIRRTLGPNFAEIFALATGFHYTEEHDIDGTYGVDENGIGDGSEGDKPCIRVECPEWEDFRLEVDGICIQAGLWMQRTYPELLARTIRGVLVAHDHRMSGRRLAAIETQSTAVTMPTGQVGAAAPLLNAIELQARHVRSVHKLPEATTLEAVFPAWVHALVRSDLAHRDGLPELSVTDAQINGWFALRGIAPQFVGNWQDINGTAADAFLAWPSEVTFLMYPAGTWIEGTNTVITLDTLYDSVLLGQNDFTALFTEEANQLVKMGHDSRAITVPVCPSGATAERVVLNCEGLDAGAAPAGIAARHFEAVDSPDESTVEPAGNASREEWVDYVVSTGVNEDDLDGLTRDELRDTYGTKA